jgi:hypothetical protein
MPAFTRRLFMVVIALLSCTSLGQTPPNRSKKLFQNTPPDENTAIRFFYNPSDSDYFHVPLVFRAVKHDDSRLNSAPILEEGRTAFISFTEMSDLLKGLANSDLHWQESETVQALGPYKKIGYLGRKGNTMVFRAEDGYSVMAIWVVHSKGTAKAILAPKGICVTLKPLDSALKTPRTLWEFQIFRMNYSCKVQGFRPEEYPDHF